MLEGNGECTVNDEHKNLRITSENIEHHVYFLEE